MRQHQEHFTKTGLTLSAVIMALLTTVSCLKDMPESLPDNIYWNPQTAFPLGQKSYGLNAESGFDTTLLEIDPGTGYPEWVGRAEVELKGTLDFNMSSIHERLDQINALLFRVNVFNGFPNEILAQAYFQDQQMSIIDSMFSEGPMPVDRGSVKSDGESIQPHQKWKDAYFDRERILRLEDASIILFIATIVVTDLDTTLIPFYPTYAFDVEIGAMLDLTLQF